MKTFLSASITYLLTLITALSASGEALAGTFTYGVSDDNKTHLVDLTAYIDTVVFTSGLTGTTNGVVWDEAAFYNGAYWFIQDNTDIIVGE